MLFYYIRTCLQIHETENFFNILEDNTKLKKNSMSSLCYFSQFGLHLVAFSCHRCKRNRDEEICPTVNINAKGFH